MSKRRLSKQQKSRIETQQLRRVSKVGETSTQESSAALGAEISGIVRSNFGQHLAVESLAAEHAGALFRCHQRSNLPVLVAGDRVVWQSEGVDTGVVVGLEPRRTVFARPNAAGDMRPLAANIDLVLIVIAPSPQPFPNLIDRYMAAVENLGLRPVLVLNKTDLLGPDNSEVIDSILSVYRKIDYPVVSVSASSGQNLSQLSDLLASHTAVIVGQSGVGKSSLINALAPELAVQVGQMSTASPKGTHTTTTACLLHAGNFDIIDSPGIREFGLWHMDEAQLLNGFIEFRPYLGHCKFRNCRHVNEPACALRDAVDKGLVSKQRMDNFFHILHSLETG